MANRSVLFCAWGERERGGDRGVGGGYSLLACLRCQTIDHEGGGGGELLIDAKMPAAAAAAEWCVGCLSVVNC